MPSVVVIAGPNGAGKSTAAPFLLRDTLGIREFVNADQIAAGLSAFNPEGAAFAAGRAMLSQLQALATEGKDFAFETTLASRSFAPFLSRLKETADYRCYLIYLWLASPAVATVRVARRVENGGHAIPPDVIARRYWRGIANLHELYRPVVDEWRVYDNTQDYSPRLVALGVGHHTSRVVDRDIWKAIRSPPNEN